MALHLPNTADATHGDQAAPDATDVDALVLGAQQVGVVTGCAVAQHAAGANMSVDVATGTAIVNGIKVVIAAVTKTIATADATNPRWDLVSVSSTGVVTVTTGTAAAVPAKPAIPANSATLAAVYVPAATTTITTGELSDRRLMLPDTYVPGPLAGAAKVLVACQSTVTNDVVWIDPATNTQALDTWLAATGADVTPTGIAVSSDGRLAYVTLKSTAGQAVAVIDTATGKQVGSWIATDLQPLSCRISPDDRTLYVLCKQAKTLIAFDTTSWSRRWTASLSAASPQSMEITPDGTLMLVTDFSGGKVWPVTLAAGTVGTSITVGTNPYGIAITPDGTTAYVANNGTAAQSVSVITISSLTVTATITGVGTAGSSQPLGIRVSPDQSTVWVTCKVDSTIVPITIPANTVGTPISVASTPYLFAISDDGRYAYVACYGPTDNVSSGTVSVVDLINKVKITDVAITGGNAIQVAYVRDRSAPRLDTLTTAGDLLVATAKRKVTRLAVPASPGQSLVPDSTALTKWSSGYPSALVRSYSKAAAYKAENSARIDATLANTAALSSGTMEVAAIVLPKGLVVNGVAFSTATTAMGAGTHQWFALLDQNLVALGVTADDTSTAWAANTRKALALGTPYTTTYEGLYYCAVVVAAGTPPSMLGHAVTSLLSDPPVLCGTSTTGLTTPTALPFTAGALTANGRLMWCAVT